MICSDAAGNEPVEYTAEIEKILHRKKTGTKNFVVRVTDPDLLRLTGGIVQGMSGSPILQNGRIVGAVTHVFVNDPTRGYGIFIENMLKEGSDEPSFLNTKLDCVMKNFAKIIVISN